jgi:hypothetical protein
VARRATVCAAIVEQIASPRSVSVACRPNPKS